MKPNPKQLEAWLDLAAMGRLDELDPQQVAALEAYLNESPHAAARLGPQPAPAVDRLAGVVKAPRSAEWDAMWAAVEDAAGGAMRVSGPALRLNQDGAGPSAATAPRSGRRPLLLRLVPVMAAAAACVALVLALRIAMPMGEPGLALQLAEHVELNEIDAGDLSVQIEYSQGGGVDVVHLFNDEGAWNEL